MQSLSTFVASVQPYIAYALSRLSAFLSFTRTEKSTSSSGVAVLSNTNNPAAPPELVVVIQVSVAESHVEPQNMGGNISLPIAAVELEASSPLSTPQLETNAATGRPALKDMTNLVSNGFKATSKTSPRRHRRSRDILDAPASPFVVTTTTPGSADWHASKATLLAESRIWNEKVKSSGRCSLPVVASSSPRSNLKDRLSGLFEFNALEGGSKVEEARRVSAAALEENSMVPVVVEEKDNLPTYTAASVSPSTSITSASSSSSSIGSILDQFEGIFNGPDWRCIMARSDEFGLRINDSMV
ncbi:hypothetical protein R3P38DRAFT_3577409 [Favolaschia claudopus]|uniref:Uncharacterized protein n=1 Tax=Favolaschia claudopus TaxID=2862362 RepID=A0AAW0DQG2_9AGAR